MKHHQVKVTQQGVTHSQPGVCVSSSSPVYGSDGSIVAGARLNVSRFYPDLPNQFGGKGVHKSCDNDGKLFDNSDDAHQFAFEKGYTQVYFRKNHS